jgi:hypothetical protein
VLDAFGVDPIVDSVSTASKFWLEDLSPAGTISKVLGEELPVVSVLVSPAAPAAPP